MTVRLKTKPALRLVESPEAELAALFAQEAVLLDELRDCRAAQAEARARYARANGLLLFPSLAKLRDVVRRGTGQREGR